MALRLEGRLVLLTGGASGIGRAIALGFARHGARVLLGDVAGIGEDLLSAGAPDLLGTTVDVTREAVCEAFVGEAVKRLGGIDILVNAAGVVGADSIETVSGETLGRVFAVNAVGTALMMRYAAPVMTARGGGKIINFASIAVAQPTAAFAYPASKHAVVGLTQSAAMALARHNIQVNALAPGQVDTPMWQGIVGRAEARAQAAGDAPGAFVAGVVQKIPAGRIAEPADMLGPALFLASADSDYVTGQTLHVNGGAAMAS